VAKYSKHYLAAVVSLATFLLYTRSLQNGFVDWDDNYYVTANNYIKSFNMEFIRWAFLDFYSYNWHPLTWISHAVDYAIWGLNPVGHHLTNVIFHAINTYLVVVVVMNLLRFRNRISGENKESDTADENSWLMIGGVTGVLFGIHPLHVESVAWIAERKDLLCAFFFLLSIIFYSGYVGDLTGNSNRGNSFSRISSRKYLFSVAFFVFAVFSKPMAVTLPFVLMILDYCPFGRVRSVKTFYLSLIEKVPFILISVCSSIITVLAQRSGSAIWADVPVATRLLVASKATVAYIVKMLFPFNLLPFYPYPRNATLLSLEYIGCILILIGITYVCVRLSGKDRFYLSVWLYFGITLAPVIGLVQVGGQFMADRYMYLPSIGPFLLIGVLFSHFVNKISCLSGSLVARRAIVSMIALMIYFPVGYLTYNQIGIWKSGIDLWTYVIKKEPEKILFAYYNRGGLFAKKGMYLEAIDDYSMVIARNYEEYSKVYIHRGLVYSQAGNLGAAVADFEKACQLGDAFGCSALKMYRTR
jgi:hypothetical protein